MLPSGPHHIHIYTSSDSHLAQETITFPNRQTLHFVSGKQFYTGLFSLKAFLMASFGGIRWPWVLKQTVKIKPPKKNMTLEVTSGQ